MYLRALGSLLTRKLSPRGIPRTRAQPQAWAKDSCPAIFSPATLGATVARPARSFHTLRDVAVASGTKLTAVMVGFVGLGGFLYFKKGTDESDILEEYIDTQSTKQYDVKDESVMKERFEQWMKQHKRAYKTQKEKALRYEMFKISASWADNYGDGNPSSFADWTEDEVEAYQYPHRRNNAFDLEGYMEEYNRRIAQGGGGGLRTTRGD